MGDNSATAGTDVICRFFATTGCRDGDKCLFLHKMPDGNSVLDSVCRYYLDGKCSFGASCHYLHIKPTTSANFVKVNRVNNYQQSDAVFTNVQPSFQSAAANFSCGVSQYVPNRSLHYSCNVSPYVPNKPINLSCGAPQFVPNRSINSDWANAPEFVPQMRKSYADMLKPEESLHASTTSRKVANSAQKSLCPYFEIGDCPSGDQCLFVHGEICEICGKACLLPFDEEQQRLHAEICEQEFVKDMELSFAVQKSADKTCGICMDVIMEKEELGERRFGILEKCNHVFCLSCIRKWRQIKQSESQSVENMMDTSITRACPECRIPSDFITPSQYWVDSEEEKSKLISDYKNAMRKKPCKHFDEGRGICPFAGACFYLHAYPDGRIAEMPPPKPRRRRNQNGDSELMDHVLLWDFLELREENNLLLHFDWDDFIYDFSDSDSDSV